jgi:hypothetical protein
MATKRRYFLNRRLEDGKNSNDPWPGDVEPSNSQDGNLIGSLCEDGLHRPALDIDLPAELVSSSTAGHFHLFIEVGLPWDRYLVLLDALAAAGVLELAYVKHCRERGMSLVRASWSRKRASS